MLGNAVKVRSGVTRTVILIGRYAIKVPTLRGGIHPGFRGRMEGFAAGYLANLSEARWSGFADWQGRIAPVLHSWLGGLIQIYPRCDPLPLNVELPLLDPDPGDVKPDNYGVLDGVIVRVDYPFG